MTEQTTSSANGPDNGTGTDWPPLMAVPSAINALATSSTGTDVPPLMMTRPAVAPAADSIAASGGARRLVTMGWQPDTPDFRDYDPTDDEVAGLLRQHSPTALTEAGMPARVDHRAYCSPIEDQGMLGSCTAQAVVGLMEYMMRRGTGNHINGSRLFVYKVTRNLLGWTGDQGAYLRTAMQAVSMFGMPPERYQPYIIARYEDEPSAFLYSFADDFRALKYLRLDRRTMSPEAVLNQVKAFLNAGYCSVFGFTVYSSLSSAADIPLPTRQDSVSGGHAVMAVGYDDNHRVRGSSMGSLIIRNSWGTGWGERGYGYMPYEYVLWGLARDFWTCTKSSWIDTGQFA